jgi:hypothetical protein
MTWTRHARSAGRWDTRALCKMCAATIAVLSLSIVSGCTTAGPNVFSVVSAGQRCLPLATPPDFSASGSPLPSTLYGKQITYSYQTQGNRIGSMIRISSDGQKIFYFQDGADVSAVGPAADTKAKPEGEIFAPNTVMDFMTESSRGDPKWQRLFILSYYRGVALYRAGSLSITQLFGGASRESGRCGDVDERLEIAFSSDFQSCSVNGASMTISARDTQDAKTIAMVSSGSCVLK